MLLYHTCRFNYTLVSLLFAHVLMVEDVCVVVNVMVVSDECDDRPAPVLCNLSLRTVVKLCTLGVLAWFPEL